MKNVLQALYTNWEDRPIRNNEHIDVNNKIKAEKQYFKESMIPNDYVRLEALETLYTQDAEFQETDADAYIAGIKFGVRLICTALYDE